MKETERIAPVVAKDLKPFVDPQVYERWQAIGDMTRAFAEGEADFEKKDIPTLTAQDRRQFHRAGRMVLVHQLLGSDPQDIKAGWDTLVKIMHEEEVQVKGVMHRLREWLARKLLPK